MPRTFPWGPFCVRAMAHTVMHFRSERTKNEGRTKEREGQEKEASMYAWQKINASCALTPRGFFRATWYRPVERSSYENTRKRSIRRLFIAFFLSSSFCASRRVRVSHVLSRLLAYSITGVSCYGIGHVQRSRLRPPEHPPDREHRQLLPMHPL